MLRRSDCDLYKILPESEARDEAIKLSAGHCFEVNLIASINVDSKRFLEGMSPFHASSNWFCAELEQILNVWLNCLDQEESPEPET